MSGAKIFLKSHCDERAQQGHLWVFSNEIERVEGAIVASSIAEIYSNQKKFLGCGFYNPSSLISARLLSRQQERIDSDFFAKKIEAAAKHRALLYPGESSYRLLFGESDFLPGLVIDRYENCFVIQSYCLGMDLLMPMALEGLKSNFKIECVVKKNDSPIRALENLGESVEVLDGRIKTPLRIAQKFGSRTVHFFADPLEGQKTGFYFDQRENRERLAAYCGGKTVLDCFSYTGGFGVYAAQCAAKEVTSIESAAQACHLLEENAKLNGLQISIRHEDVYSSLDQFKKEKRKFDIIVLDPPALAKSKKNLFSAMRKYQKLNESALALLNQDGILFSCSCSHHVTREAFVQVLNRAAISQNRRMQLLEMRGQSRDHPILPSMPETEYLKCAVVRVN